MNNEMSLRTRAHQGDAEVPLLWTPEHVIARMIEAMRTLRRASWGQANFKTGAGAGWPQVLTEAGKAFDRNARATMTKEMLKDLRIATASEIEEDRPLTSNDQPSPFALSRMDEAIGWPLVYLYDEPLEADAVRLLAISKSSRDAKVEPVLRVRREKAAALAWTRAADIEAKDPAYRQVVEARRRIALALNAEYVPRMRDEPACLLGGIQAEMREEYRARCINAGAAPSAVSAMDVVTDRCLHRWQVDRHAKRGLLTIATALDAAGLPVR